MKKTKVLVVDDEENIVFAIRLLLTKSNYDVICAYNGEEAIEQYKKHLPSTVLLDIMMPIKNGFDTAKELRQLDIHSQTRIFFLTAKGTMQDKMTAYANGGDDYIVKPFNNKDLLEKISCSVSLNI